MARTEAQKRAVEAFKRKLESQKKADPEGTAAISRRIGTGRSSGGGSITEVSPGVFRTKDPTTGKFVLSQDRAFIQSVAGVGQTEAEKTFTRSGSGSSTSRSRFEAEVKRRGLNLEAQAQEQKMISEGLGQQVLDERSGKIESQVQESPGFRIGLSEAEKRKTTSEVIAGRFREVGSGVVAAGGSLLEGAIKFAGDFGQQTIEFDESGQRIDKSFQFSDESFIGQQQAKPSSTGKVLGQVAVFTPLVGAATTQIVTGIASQGIKQTAIETVSEFSPFKIKPQTFGALTSGTADDIKFDLTSFKQTTGDTTKRLVTGKAKDFDDVFLVSKQVTSKVGGKDVTLGVTDITAPTTTFRTGTFTEGQQIIRTESFGTGLGGGKTSKVSGFPQGFSTSQALEGVTGAGGKVTTGTRASLFVDESGRVIADVNLGALEFGTPKDLGSVSKGFSSGVSTFGGGKGKVTSTFDKSFGLKQKVRVDDFNVRGVEFDIGAISGRGSAGTSVSTGKGGGSGLETTAKQISASITDIAPQVVSPTGASITSVSSVVSPVVSVPSAASSFSGGSQELVSKPEIKPKESFGFKSPIVDFSANIDSIVDVKPRTRVSPRTRSGIKQTFARDPALSFKPAVDVGVDLGIGQALKQPPALKLSTKQDFFNPKPDPFLGFAGSGFTPKLTPGAGFGGLFGTGRSTRRKQKGKRRLKERIAPSLTGLAKFDLGGITGKDLKLSGSFGRSPTNLRLVPKSFIGTRRSDLGLGGFGFSKPRKRKSTKRRKK